MDVSLSPRGHSNIQVHPRCCPFYRLGQMCKDVYPPLRCHTERSHGPKNPPCSTCSSLPPPKPLATTDLFTVSIVLSFQECHTVGITHYVAFSDWLLSLSDMHLRFLPVFSWFDSSFLFSVNNTPLSQFIHSPTEGRLGYFQVLAIVHRAAINIGVQVSVWS